jgi:hypothetical protein
MNPARRTFLRTAAALPLIAATGTPCASRKCSG